MNYLKGTAGALAGTLCGAALFVLLLRFGLYAGLLVGVGAGLGSQWLFPGKSPGMGVIAAVIGLVGGILVEWYAMPFVADESLPFFLKNLHQVNAVHLVFLAIGTVLAFVWGQGK